MGLVDAVMPLRHGWGVELRYLRHFIAVAEERSITSAAARLRVAQPALSRQLRALEDEIGSPLMERNSRGVMLTQAGLAFAEDAQRILAAVEVAVSAARARSRGTKGDLSVGYAPSTTAESWLSMERTHARCHASHRTKRRFTHGVSRVRL